jgi:hypothetical protein
VVHGILIAVNIILAVVLGIIGWRGLRGSSGKGVTGRIGDAG